MGENHALAPLPQRTLDGWHRFVASADRDLLASLLSEHIVFRSPFLQSPIPGRTATLLVLTTVIQIFENFRYHRTFISGSHDVALEFFVEEEFALFPQGRLKPRRRERQGNKGEQDRREDSSWDFHGWGGSGWETRADAATNPALISAWHWQPKTPGRRGNFSNREFQDQSNTCH